MGSAREPGGAQIRNPHGIPDEMLREEVQEHGFLKGVGSAYLRHKSDQEKAGESRMAGSVMPSYRADKTGITSNRSRAVTSGREYRKLGKFQ